MTPQPVEAVFFFRWNRQVSQATYGRLSTKDGTQPATRFTKNYIQVSGDAATALDNLYPGALGLHHNVTQNLAISFSWPTGGESGELRPHSGDPTRIDLFWPGSGRAPLPWKLGPLGAAETTIPGDPDQTTEDGADLELEAVRQHDLRPWLLAVKVQNDPTLHARTYLENPAPYPQLAHTDLGLVPRAPPRSMSPTPRR